MRMGPTSFRYSNGTRLAVALYRLTSLLAYLLLFRGIRDNASRPREYVVANDLHYWPTLAVVDLFRWNVYWHPDRSFVRSLVPNRRELGLC